WILDVGVRDEDLVSLKKKDAADFYDRIKDDAFEAKAFQHTPQPQDATEESRLPALVAAWKQKRAKKNTNSADDGDASEEEEDEGGRGALLRGYPKAGWQLAIQKVISNKRTAQKGKINIKTKQEGGESTPEAPALAKLFGLTASTGRDKFRLDRHDDIQEYSKTLTGAMNAGGKFRHAEALMWAKEDQASWEAAATAEEDVDWVERQQLVASGFKHMVDSLHASWKFRPFVATMLMAWLNTEGRVNFEWQAVPDGIHVRQPFEQKHEQLFKDTVNSMYEWAEKPLKDYLATREGGVKAVTPLFPLSAEALDDISVKKAGADKAAFGSQEIPWADIAREPHNYYDTAQLPHGFPDTGLAALTRTKWFELASKLVSAAGSGTLGFFCQLGRPSSPMPHSPSPPPPTPPPHRPASPTPPPPTPPPRPPMPPPHRPASPTPPPPTPPPRPPTPPHRPASPTPPPPTPPPRPPTPPPHRPASPTPPPPTPPPRPPATPPHRPTSPTPLPPNPPANPSPRPPTPPPVKKRGRKRKAEDQLVPEDAAQESGGGEARRTARTRKTPAEAQLEREKAAAAAVTAGKVKPSYEYILVPRSPAKPKRQRAAR
ncbi:hypothetical protein B0H13DRAFT_2346677, partial [Mycena leptocephala]